ncbi:hypothetical protein [uncultured Xanthomonas sp.]|uniref:hypothetical protein n=1 Tax=uncultured Xanthomonas sp. TaxID=152831 RepID=UPI0025FC4030|nr:hypothetical protein [uncultured Xanthomonas sp.]
MKQRLLALAIALLSAGWVLPLWCGVEAWLTFWQRGGTASLQSGPPGDSFPYLAFASACSKVVSVWLAVAIGIWAYLGARACLRQMR